MAPFAQQLLHRRFNVISAVRSVLIGAVAATLRSGSAPPQQATDEHRGK
jgi:hypothetical protein